MEKLYTLRELAKECNMDLCEAEKSVCECDLLYGYQCEYHQNKDVKLTIDSWNSLAMGYDGRKKFIIGSKANSKLLFNKSSEDDEVEVTNPALDNKVKIEKTYSIGEISQFWGLPLNKTISLVCKCDITLGYICEFHKNPNVKMSLNKWQDLVPDSEYFLDHSRFVLGRKNTFNNDISKDSK